MLLFTLALGAPSAGGATWQEAVLLIDLPLVGPTIVRETPGSSERLEAGTQPMTLRAWGINPAMLRWARDRSGYSIDEVARRRRVSPERISDWESGNDYPTWRQLEALAHEDYHRATVFFFLDEPPEESTISAEFRRLPPTTLSDLHPDTLYAVRQARGRQEDLRTLLEPRRAEEGTLVEQFRRLADVSTPKELAGTIRDRLGVDLTAQRSWANDDAALSEWRQQVENNGIWVFKKSFRQADIAGFCLSDSLYPVIYLNNGQAKPRQIFTLFHELAHLLFDFNHLERLDTHHYLDALSDSDRAAEVACNAFAGEFLVPSADFAKAASGQYPSGPIDENVTSLAKTYRVSREVILRKFLDGGGLSASEYRETVKRWRADQRPSRKEGGNYYATQATYLGSKYLRAAFSAFDAGRIEYPELSACLGVKGSSLAKLEPYAWRE